MGNARIDLHMGKALQKSRTGFNLLLYETHRNFARRLIIRTLEKFQTATPILTVENFEKCSKFRINASWYS